MSLMCSICKRMFSTRSNLNKHLVNVHNERSTTASYEKNVFFYQCLEEDCNRSFRKNLDLVDHLKEKHGFNIIHEDLEFESTKDFRMWKEDIETSEKCNYIIPRGTRITATGEILTYFICNRSGKKPLEHKTDRKRRTKSQGSRKLNRNCISQMNVIQLSNGTVRVTRQKTHYGHSKDIRHLHVSQRSGHVITSKLVNEASETKILDMNRNVAPRLSVPSETVDNTNNIKEKILLEISGLHAKLTTANLDNVSGEQLSQVLSYIETANASLNLVCNDTSKLSFSSHQFNKCNNKNIDKQLRFHSTQKKKYKKTDGQEKSSVQTIANTNSSFNGSDVVISNNPLYDHKYCLNYQNCASI